MDNVTNIEPADNEERLLKGILEGDTETNIEPAGNKERLLKGILEKLGGGGGGGGATSVTLVASGDNLSGDISLADLKTALSNGVVLLSFPTDGNADERVVAEYTDDSTNGLRIGVFSEDEYIVYSVVDDGSDGITLTVVSEKGVGAKVISASATLTTAIQTAFGAFLMQALQSQGSYTNYKDNTTNTYTEITDAIEYIKKGYTVVFDGLSFKFNPSWYLEDNGQPYALSMHYAPLGNTNVPGVGYVAYSVDISVSVDGHIGIQGFAKTTS